MRKADNQQFTPVSHAHVVLLIVWSGELDTHDLHHHPDADDHTLFTLQSGFLFPSKTGSRNMIVSGVSLFNQLTDEESPVTDTLDLISWVTRMSRFSWLNQKVICLLTRPPCTSSPYYFWLNCSNFGDACLSLHEDVCSLVWRRKKKRERTLFRRKDGQASSQLRYRYSEHVKMRRESDSLQRMRNRMSTSSLWWNEDKYADLVSVSQKRFTKGDPCHQKCFTSAHNYISMQEKGIRDIHKRTNTNTSITNC